MVLLSVSSSQGGSLEIRPVLSKVAHFDSFVWTDHAHPFKTVNAS